MADEQTPSFSDKLKMDAKTLWNEHRVFFIIFGVLILVAKFRDVLISLLVSSGKRVLEDAQKKDSTLANEENQAKAQADELVKKAQEEPNKEKPVDDDWYKKN